MVDVPKEVAIGPISLSDKATIALTIFESSSTR